MWVTESMSLMRESKDRAWPGGRGQVLRRLDRVFPWSTHSCVCFLCNPCSRIIPSRASYTSISISLFGRPVFYMRVSILDCPVCEHRALLDRSELLQFSFFFLFLSHFREFYPNNYFCSWPSETNLLIELFSFKTIRKTCSSKFFGGRAQEKKLKPVLSEMALWEESQIHNPEQVQLNGGFINHLRGDTLSSLKHFRWLKNSVKE